jgi:PAS domain-containing protein
MVRKDCPPTMGRSSAHGPGRPGRAAPAIRSQGGPSTVKGATKTLASLIEGVVVIDPSRRITLVNRAAEEIVGSRRKRPSAGLSMRSSGT